MRFESNQRIKRSNVKEIDNESQQFEIKRWKEVI